jgi:hypothetical protein
MAPHPRVRFVTTRRGLFGRGPAAEVRTCLGREAASGGTLAALIAERLGPHGPRGHGHPPS